MSTPTTAVRERPMLYAAPMVRALLAGTKTQTRRIVKLDRWMVAAGMSLAGATRDPGLGDGEYLKVPNLADGTRHRLYCPHGTPGERLWVRETVWRAELEGMGVGRGFLVYDDEWRRDKLGVKEPAPAIRRQWTASDRWGRVPSIHMPRWACRIVLEITDVRVERLQAITEDDAKAEGVERWAHVVRGPLFPCSEGDEIHPDGTHAYGYRLLWDRINGAGAWDANPWVWALTFRRVMP